MIWIIEHHSIKCLWDRLVVYHFSRTIRFRLISNFNINFNFATFKQSGQTGSIGLNLVMMIIMIFWTQIWLPHPTDIPIKILIGEKIIEWMMNVMIYNHQNLMFNIDPSHGIHVWPNQTQICGTATELCLVSPKCETVYQIWISKPYVRICLIIYDVGWIIALTESDYNCATTNILS